MEAFTTLTGLVVPLDRANVNTDEITPARFLKTIRREPMRTITSPYIVLPIDNIDTDIIIPARFLKVTEKTGLGRHLFADWRYAEDGAPRPDFVLNRPEAARACVLVAGDNFGCGSSREHASWALADFGFRIVRTAGHVGLARLDLGGLEPVAEPRRARLVQAVKDVLAPAPPVPQRP